MSEFSRAGLDRLKTALAAHVDDGSMPGLVALVSRAGETHVEAIGTQAFDNPAPMTPDSLFRIASITKPVTAAAAMSLVEEGLFTLDEPIDRLLPELANRRVLKRLEGPLDDTVPARRPIMVRDLMAFTLGMGVVFTADPLPILEALKARGMAMGPQLPQARDADDYIAKLAELPLMGQPGEAWMYDTGAVVLGALMERATGRRLPDILRERIFEPLGMADAGFMVPPEKLHRLTACYMQAPGASEMTVFDPDGPQSQWARPPGFASGSAGMVCTAGDYLAFARMMMDGGMGPRGRVLPAASVAEMQRGQITPAQQAVSPFVDGFWQRTNWGLGVSIVTQAGPDEPRGFGWNGGYGTSAYWDPGSGLVGVLMTQKMFTSPKAPLVLEAFWRGAREALV
jgi:CubicO group peptidase (beta-lactamase class C family)